jgi:hypothetical protein
MEGRGLDSNGSATRPPAFSCKHGTALSGPRKDGLLSRRATVGSHKRLCLMQFVSLFVSWLVGLFVRPFFGRLVSSLISRLVGWFCGAVG